MGSFKPHSLASALSSTWVVYMTAIAVWVVAFFLALKVGAVTDAEPELIHQVRLPRVLLASVIGVGLSVAGAVLQAIFSNPLCEPYTLGISSGAALGALVGASLGLEFLVHGVEMSAFLGSLLFTGILILISYREKDGRLTLLLTGVMLGFLGMSLVAIWVSLTDSSGIQSAIFWLFGDLSRARMASVPSIAMAILILSSAIWSQSRCLDGFLMGEEAASALGVEVAQTRRQMMLATSLLAGICVSAAGMIGFVGLVAPHFARRWVGSLHFKLIPLAAIWGSTLLVVADLIARVAMRPTELPVGVITAVVGSPVFLWILLKRQSRV